MKRLFFALIFALVFGVSAAFAAPVNITCDPQTDVEWYNIYIDSNLVATSTAIVDVESGLYYLLFDLKTLNLADGSYIATATAENKWEVSGISNPCPFTKVAPAAPTGLRVSSD